ncbi:hypothetical protein GGTG_01323 [Gaeumannomyces tritici R3-111a-1]|uniref:HTH La-type RNA-binding domain-containing protein n=1 Tax=Gaeumannomyces tritici (strain R3-111a-1) TaxID=644352 RepID=J3NJ89_GAET3|nr:hypothetical protein GGTG_01323 [Gaeumannomyces tritici R3-111a-1]EJT81340.1 hypothetical protein GGTG_01323 [Gaeumannomyces tritici R3-111a-1]
MATTVAKSAVPADTMASAPVFSYAQAARGQVVPPATSQPENSAPPSTSSQGKDDNVSTTNTIATSATSSNASDVQDIPKALQESTDLSNPKNLDSELSSVVDSVGQDSRDDAASATGSQSQGPSKGPGSSTVASQAGDAPDSRKHRKGKKSKGSEKDDEQDKTKENLKVFEPPKVELSEAPIPAVNVWHQRKEERAAATGKPAAVAPTKPGAPGAETPAEAGKALAAKKPTSSPADESSESGNKAPSTAASARAPRRPTDSARVAPANENIARRNAPRGSRMQGKDDRTPASDNLPPVQDAALWPSIELAAADDAKKKASEKPEQSEKPERPEDGAAAKPRPKKEWVAVPITPTFTYETQFTHPKQPRTRGGGRGGRETGTSRGGHVPPTSASPAEKDSTTPAGLPPKTGSEVRERPRDAPAPVSHPRQTSQNPGMPKRNGPDSSTREPRKATAMSANDKPKAEYGATHYPPKGEMSARGSRPDVPNGEQAHADRRRQSADRREPRAHDPASDNGNNHPVRETRNERGRGGYRGRGGANHGAGGHHQQSSYGGNGQRFMGGSNGIGSQPFSPTANQYQPFLGHANGNRRAPARAQTGPSHSGQRLQNGGTAPSRMPSLPIPASTNPEFPVQAYQPAYMGPGYGGEDYILQGLKQQVEYYFSPDNLLRDIYLRARMDSQGYVLLKTIAQFKRVQQLAPRYEFIQAACAHSQEVDYVVAEDGLERLRSRRDMTPFILDMPQRVEESRNNGPTSVAYHNLDRQPYGNGYGHPMYMASPTTFHPDFHQNGGEHAHPIYAANGVHFAPGVVMGGDYANGPRYNGESQLSANVPDFSPISHQRPSLETFQRFQDADIPKLKVVLDSSSKPLVATNGTAPASEVGPAAEHLPNGTSTPATSSSETAEADRPTQSDGSSYADFHKKALDQRQDAAPGETPQDMHNLYKFWLDLLSNTFNTKLYNEFRQLAIEDGTKKPANVAGLRYLVTFYEALFNSRRAYPEDFDTHYQEAKSIVDSFSGLPNGEAHA